MSKIDELKKILDYHNNLYYTLDNPEISDFEYDAIKAEYIKLAGEYEYVPGDVLENLDKVTHKYPVKSLSKVNNGDDLRAEIIRLMPVVVQPKIDGLTVVGYPGTETGAGMFVTRGNGTVGEKITNTALMIEDINRVGKGIDNPIRMEAYMPISVFNQINSTREEKDKLKNPRNAAAGMLRHKDASKVQGVHYLAYNIMGSTTTETDQLEVLANNNFHTVPSWRFTDVDEAVNFIMNFDKSSLDYEIDGMVIKSDLPDSLTTFGSTGHHPRNAVAYKFPPEGKWTLVDNVTWQVGKTGKITPVAEIAPIDIDGSTISRVTLHNFSIMQALGIDRPREVFVIKANGVIPAIIESRNIQDLAVLCFMYTEPTECPACGETIYKVNDQIFCPNPACKEKMVARIAHIGSRDALDIEGLSIETAGKIVEMYDPKSAFDIFKLTTEDIVKLPGFAKKSAENLYSAIQKARAVDLNKFLYAAGIPMVGRSVTRDIANTFGSYQAFISDMISDFKVTKTIEGIGPILIDNMKRYGHLWTELSAYVVPREATRIETPDVVLIFVITGTLEKPRSYYENIIRSAGHKLSGSVSKATSYVLVGEDAGSKLEKAMSLGFDKGGKILRTEEELLKVLGR